MAQQTNLLQGPEPVETAELHFKLQCRLKVFETNSKYEEGHCSILAASQYYGLIFVGTLSGFSVITTKSLNAGVSQDEFPKKYIWLNSRPTHISVDISQRILAVVCKPKIGSLLILYNIQSFALKEVTPFKLTPISKLSQNTAADVVDLIWQPNAEGSLVICLSDGSVVALPQATKDETMFTLPSSTQATCFCWSPKGKQIVVGTASGTLSQYKPDLKLVKTLPAPPLYNGAAMVVSVLWISSFQFAVAYNDRANPESFPVITIVNAAKNEPVSVVNYDDITYSTTLFRNHQIYMSHQTPWNLIFVSSANSIEVAVLHLKDNLSWEQWLLGDASRAELPLNPDRQETFPLGWAFDFTSQETIPWGESTLPPMPRLLLVSDEGLLCVFNVVNAAANAPQLCAPPKESFDDSQFTVPAKTTPPAGSVPRPDVADPVQAAEGILGSPPTFGEGTKPSYNFQTGFGRLGAKLQGNTSQDGSTGAQQQPEQTQLQIQKQPQVQVQQQHQLQPQIQQQHQLQPQIQQQHQPQPQIQQQPPAPPAHSKPSPTPFKLPVSPFGTAFTFGAHLNLTPAEKPKMTETTASPFALQQSSSQKDIFGKTFSQSTPIKHLEGPLVEKASVISVPATKKPEEVESPVKAEEVTAKGDSAGPATPELAAVDDSVYLSALQEEVDHFNSELQQLSAKVGNLDIQLGTEEDKARMKKSIDNLYTFWNELKETTEGQSSEIHAVVMDLMEAFAWLEDAKSRNLQRKNPSYIELKKSEELDPLNARHMNEISHLKYYIVNQLKQLTGYLEKEWMDHQENYRNEIKSKMTVPPLEEVYKTMHFQLKILHKQKALVEELREKIAMRKRKNKSHSFLISTANPAPTNSNDNRASELSKLADKLIHLKIDSEEDSTQTAAWELMKSQLAAISERSKKLTRDKQTALRDALSERDMVKIRPVKTTLETSTFLRSLHLGKTAPITSNPKPFLVHPDHHHKHTPAPKLNPEPKPDSLPKSKTDDKPMPLTKIDAPKSLPLEKANIPLTVQSAVRPEEKSPLASLSGFVSSIGKKNEGTAFVFRSTTVPKSDPGSDASFGSKPEQKQEEPKISQPFTFGVSNPAESIFGKKEPTVFGPKPTFNLPSSITVTMTKSEVTKTTTAPNITITPVTTAAATTPRPLSFNPATTTTTTTPRLMSFNSATTTTTTTPRLMSFNPATTTTTTTPRPLSFNPATTTPTSTSFTFTHTTTTTASAPLFTFTPATTSSSTALPKVNLFGKEATSGFGTLPTTESLFSATSTPASVFGTTMPTFGGANKTTIPTTSSSTPLFGVPKTTADTPAQPTGFGQPQTSDSKSQPSNETAHPPSEQTEEVDVVAVDEPIKKPDPPVDKSKDSPKPSTTTSTSPATFFTPSPPAKSPLEITSTSPTNVVTAAQSSVPTTNVFSKSPVAPTTSSTDTSTATPATVNSSTTPATTSSVFSFTSVATPVFFGQTATTTTNTTTTSFFGTSTTTTSLFGQVSSTTPTPSIFGGSTPTTPATSIFGGSTPVKPVPDQPSTPSTTHENLFGSSTPTTNSFGQVSTTPSSAPVFGQKSESVDQTTNLFGQLLSDSNKSVFGSPSSTTTTTNIFTSSSKSLFEPTTTTTTTSAAFGVAFGTSVFGQPTTASSVFGQAQTSTSNSFFGYNTYNSLNKTTTAAPTQTAFKNTGFSEPIFGQSVFGLSFKTTNISSFGGSPSSIFGGTPSSSTTVNVFQTPTTSTTFGSSVPGPFSGGTSSFAESGFGSTSSTFQKPLAIAGGFAGPAVFGGSPGGSTTTPSFGGSPTFGGSPSFGSLPTFGSVSQGAFGQSSGSATFENLANQNMVGFGNLAQQTQSQGFGSGFGSSSFENKSAFGGNSFSSWRSK